MYGYIYKITNLETGLIYIGQKHSLKFLKNSYLGGGKLIRRAVEKYGKDKFKVELIEKISSKEEMDEREIYWISFYKATDKNVGYNISNGGNVNRAMSGEHNPFYGKTFDEETLKKLSKSHSGKTPWNKGLTSDKDERVKKNADALKKSIKINGCSVKNSVWINDGEITKMIQQSDVQYYLNGGWRRGRLSLSKRKYEDTNAGKIRINNEIEEKVVTSEDLNNYLNCGWKKGRLKFKSTSNFGKHLRKKVVCVETGVVYESLKEVKTKLGLSCGSCCKGKRKTAGGYHWQYVKGKITSFSRNTN